ncbi:hypothetical protein B0H19DRAFT_1234658 [Mycena capillaripes]|nr:hypothetical protein B0H19DRAFT_1234658 [Mycena capillaripes]
MPGTLSPAYACGCLNVQITPVPHPEPFPDQPLSTPDFTQVHVGDEGISIVHPQVTLRIRTRGELASRNRRERYTSLTCLVCQVLVYRVHQIVSLDADGRDGPLIPTEEWVEQDILKSPSGWIEVHSQCLTGDAIARVAASSQYSALFSLAIPIAASPPVSPQQPPVEDGPQKTYLEHLPPLFLPPPFTPSHPVFVHLASLAKTESEAQRAAVERDLAEIVRAKSAQLAHTESRLRRQVETVWLSFRKGLESVEQMDAASGSSVASPRSPRHTRQPHDHRDTRGARARLCPAARAPDAPGTHTRNLVPLRLAPHHGIHPPPPREPTSPRRPASTLSNSSRTLSGSSVTLAGSPAPPRVFEDGASVLQFGRRPDDDMNTAASYQFFRNLESDMARSKRERERAASSSSTAHHAESPRAGPSSSSAVNGNGTGNGHGVAAPHPDEIAQEAEAGVRDKGKRKQRKMVTFESQPAVVTIKREVLAEKEEEARLAQNDGEVMIFDLEADGKGQESTEGAVMTFVEQPTQPRSSEPRRTGRKPPTDSTGLPQSFSVLRPTSLPVPSNVRPPRRGPSPPDDSTDLSTPDEDTGDDEEEEEEAEELDSRDQEIMKLVAADTPSHRGRWKKDSAEWRTLVSRDRYSNTDDDDEFDDDEVAPRPSAHINGSSQAGMPGSMPIAIRPPGKPRTNLSLASYRPQTMPAAPTEPEPEPAATMPSSSVRRAVYAERDLQRAMDPGALDFSADVDVDSVIKEEDEGDDNGDGEGGSSDATGATGIASLDDRGNVRGGRKNAFKILQAREQLPDSGMWRSLA